MGRRQYLVWKRWIAKVCDGREGRDSGIANIAERMAKKRVGDETLVWEGIENMEYWFEDVAEMAGQVLSLLMVEGRCG